MSVVRQIGSIALRHWVVALFVTVATSVAFGPHGGAHAQDLPGVTDTEIRIGNISAYTGPAAAWSVIPETQAAFFRMINDQGGINGRLIRFISYDDGFSPPRTLERARRLVERDDVLLIFQSLGTSPNLAIREYMNEVGVPQLFIATGASLFDDPVNYPWTMRWNASYRTEASVMAQHVLAEFDEATFGILYQNDDFGRDFLGVLMDELADHYATVSQPYDVTDPTVDAQIAAMKAAGVDVFINLAAARQASQAIRRATELQWSPYHILVAVSASIGGVLEPAGLENSVGIVIAASQKPISDSRWDQDVDVIAFKEFMQDYYPDGDTRGGFEAYGYLLANALVEVLRRCGDDLSRQNVMRHSADLSELQLFVINAFGSDWVD